MTTRDKKKKPYRDGKVHVCREMCSTCIFRPSNIIHLEPGRVAAMITGADKNRSAIICHSSSGKAESVCRGYYDRDGSVVMRLADAMGAIEFDEPQSLKDLYESKSG